MVLGESCRIAIIDYSVRMVLLQQYSSDFSVGKEISDLVCCSRVRSQATKSAGR